jgi:putative ATP-binding cassette transporter
VAVYQLYLTQMLQIRWRRWLTERYLSAWLTRRRLLPDAARGG